MKNKVTTQQFPKFIFIFLNRNEVINTFVLHDLRNLIGQFSDKVTRIGINWYVADLLGMESYFVSTHNLESRVTSEIQKSSFCVTCVLSHSFLHGFLVALRAEETSSKVTLLTHDVWKTFLASCNWNHFFTGIVAFLSCLQLKSSKILQAHKNLVKFCQSMECLRFHSPSETETFSHEEITRRFGEICAQIWLSLTDPSADFFSVILRSLSQDLSPKIFSTDATELPCYENRNCFRQAEGQNVFVETFFGAIEKLTPFHSSNCTLGILDFQIEFILENQSTLLKDFSLRTGIFAKTKDTCHVLENLYHTYCLDISHMTFSENNMVYEFEFFRSIRVIPVCLSQHHKPVPTLFDAISPFEENWIGSIPSLEQKSIGRIECFAFGGQTTNCNMISSLDSKEDFVSSHDFVFRCLGARRPLMVFQRPIPVPSHSKFYEKLEGNLCFLESDSEVNYFVFRYLDVPMLFSNKAGDCNSFSIIGYY